MSKDCVFSASPAKQMADQELTTANVTRLLRKVEEASETLARLAHSAKLLDRQSPLRSHRCLNKECRHCARTADVTATDVRALIRTRRMRARFIDPALFSDPAWDMMLDLMAARLEGQRISVSSLCIAAVVPATTALRWIRVLTAQEIFVRVPDVNDRRRVFIELSPKAVDAITSYFEAIAQ